MAQDDRIARLARQIDATEQAERFLVDADEAANLRRRGACELHQLCAEFVSSINSKLPEPLLELSPPTYAASGFRANAANLLQISSQGRQMQIAFQAPAPGVSTEKFPIAYILEGEVRTYNQRMLDRFDIRSLAIFYCVDAGIGAWRFFDWRTRGSGLVQQQLLVSLMEPLF